MLAVSLNKAPAAEIKEPCLPPLQKIGRAEICPDIDPPVNMMPSTTMRSTCEYVACTVSG